MIKKQRKFADKTRRTILKSAVALFSKQGFSATSMQSIAKKAKVNEALLYHHFTNKAQLWKSTKAYLFEQCNSANVALPNACEGLRAILSHLIHQRFELYNNNTVARIMLWQQLEPNQEGIMGANTTASPDQWIPLLTELQNLQQIRQDIDLELLVTWIASSVMGVVFGKAMTFKSSTDRKQLYCDWLIDEFYDLCATESAN